MRVRSYYDNAMTGIDTKCPKRDRIEQLGMFCFKQMPLLLLLWMVIGCNTNPTRSFEKNTLYLQQVGDSLYYRTSFAMSELDSIDGLLGRIDLKEADLPLLSQAYRELGRRYSELRAFGPACLHYLKALELAVLSQDKKQETHALMALGSIFYYFKDYERSIEYFNRALQTGRVLNDGDHLAWTYHEMIKSALQAEKYTDVLTFAHQGLALKNIEKPFWYIQLYNDVGLAYFRQKKYAQALEAFQKATQILPQQPRVAGFVAGNIGAVLLESNQPKASVPYFIKDIAYSLENNDLRSAAGAAVDLSSAFLQLKDKASAQKYLEFADSLFLVSPEHNFSKKRFNTWSNLIDELKSPKESLQMHRMLIEALKKQLSAEMDENTKQLTILLAMMESHDKLKASQAAIAEEKRVTARYFYFSILMVTFLAAAIGFFKSRNRIMAQRLKIESLRATKNEQELQIVEQQKQLQEVELELQKEMADNLKLRLENVQRVQTHVELTKGFLEDLSNQLVGVIDETLQNGQNLYPQVRSKLEGSLRLFQQANVTKTDIEMPSNEETNSFIHRVKMQYPQLTTDEVKLCTYLHLNMSTKEIANIKMITIAGVNKSRNRIRKKLGLNPSEDLNEFLGKL